MAQVLVFGKNGQVARALAEEVSENGHEGILPGGYRAEDWIFLSSKEVFFQSPQTILAALEKHQPLVVINAAAYTAVDKAESEKDLAMSINGAAPGVIAEWCKTHQASFVHISTDYVFPGDGNDPWREDDRLGPVNHYGVTKLEGERRIQESACHHVILRTSWVYSADGVNFVRTMLRLGSEKEELKIVNDQIGSPTSAMDLAKVIFEIMDHPRFREEKKGGIYHVAGEGFVSWYDFAKEIFFKTRSLGLRLRVKNVHPIASSEYPTPAKRPLNSRLDQSKITKDFGWHSAPWQNSLEEVLEEVMVREASR